MEFMDKYGKPLESAEDRRKRRFELVAAVIIGIAAILTAIATFQGSTADGQVAELNTESVARTLYANDAFNQANAQTAVERDWIFAFVAADANNEPAADFWIETMPPALVDLAIEWLDEGAIGDPFSGEYPALQALDSVALLEIGAMRDEEANCALFKASVADAQGDTHSLATVFFALALVVGGIAALLKSKVAQFIVMITATVSLVLGSGVMVYANAGADFRTEKAVDFFFDVDGNTLTAMDAVAEADRTCPNV